MTSKRDFSLSKQDRMPVPVSVPPVAKPKDQQKLMVAVRIRPLSHKEEVAASGQKSTVNHGAVIAKAIDDKTVMVYDPTGIEEICI